MLNITIICVGKLKEKFYKDAVAEFQKRLSRYCRLKIIELAEQKLPQHPSLGQIETSLDKEYEDILSVLPKSGKVVALCVEGNSMSSEEVSHLFWNWAVGGVSDVTFIIGSSYGLSPRTKNKADLKLSLSQMTFPHHLARVILLEQIYRAYKIQEGSEYHK